MYLRRQEYPEEGELVICTVTKVNPHSVFAELDEYGKSGLIHISEVSAGRIRNIRDYVKEGRKVICKILKIDREKGYIDLSLRRVNEGQRRQKATELKKEQKAEKTVDAVADALKIKSIDLYKKIAPQILKEYNYIYECFEDILTGNYKANDLGLGAKETKVLEETIGQRMTPPTFEIIGKLKMQSFESNGIEKIKKALEKLEKNNIHVNYAGNAQYNIKITADTALEAEKILEDNVESLIEQFVKEKGEASFARIE